MITFFTPIKNRPWQYLNVDIRNNISSFSVFSTPDEITTGLKALETDIGSGKINEVMGQYENDLGDYLFLVAEKK